MTVLAACVFGVKQLGSAQTTGLEQIERQAVSTWRPSQVGWNQGLWVPARAIDLSERIHKVLPTEGWSWALLQPAPHALSALSGLKPLSELRGYDQQGLGLPIEVSE